MASSGEVAKQRDPRVTMWIEAELDKLEVMAREAADRFWKYHYESRVDAAMKDWSTYGCRVRRGSTAIVIQWRFIYYVGPKGKRKIKSKDLTRGASCAYTPRTFNKASERELEEIMKAEELFCEVRKLSRTLTKAARQVDGYSMVVNGVEARLGRKVGETEAPLEPSS